MESQSSFNLVSPNGNILKILQFNFKTTKLIILLGAYGFNVIICVSWVLCMLSPNVTAQSRCQAVHHVMDLLTL